MTIENYKHALFTYRSEQKEIDRLGHKMDELRDQLERACDRERAAKIALRDARIAFEKDLL